MITRARNPLARRRSIQRALTAHGVMSVEELCRMAQASPATVRRDLAALERDGILERSFGGAALKVERPAEQAFAEREEQDVASKRRIAEAVVERLTPGATVFMNDGSTVMAIAREIVASGLELFVATPAVNVAAKLSESASVMACLLGGFVRQRSLATAGPFAESMIEQINADFAIISPDGLAPKHGLTFSHAEDAAIARKMGEHARHIIAVATSAKFRRLGRIRAMPMGAVGTLISDRVTGVLAGRLHQTGVEVIETGSAERDLRQ